MHNENQPAKVDESCYDMQQQMALRTRPHNLLMRALQIHLGEDVISRSWKDDNGIGEMPSR